MESMKTLYSYKYGRLAVIADNHDLNRDEPVLAKRSEAICEKCVRIWEALCVRISVSVLCTCSEFSVVTVTIGSWC